MHVHEPLQVCNTVATGHVAVDRYSCIFYTFQHAVDAVLKFCVTLSSNKTSKELLSGNIKADNYRYHTGRCNAHLYKWLGEASTVHYPVHDGYNPGKHDGCIQYCPSQVPVVGKKVRVHLKSSKTHRV